jgi:hypothetical protein
MNFEIKRHLLRSDLRAIAARIGALKRVLRARWERPMADEQRELCRLRLRATELCALQAFARGKFHVRWAPRGAPNDWSAPEYHRRIAERLGPSYSPALEQSA